jgi:hypothetical protein
MKAGLIKSFSLLNILGLIALLVLPLLFFVPQAQASMMKTTFVRLDRMAAATTTTLLVCAQPATSSAVNVDVQVAFPAGFTVNTTTPATTWAATTANIPASTTAWPGIAGATPTVSSQTVTWTYSGNQTLNTGTTYCFTAASTSPYPLTNAAAANNYVGTITTRTTAGATIDSGSYALSTISTNDQITVNGTVTPTFTFTFTGGTDTFSPTLSNAAVSVTAGRNASVVTNAANGWVMWVKSANAGLNSATTGATIPTAGSVDDVPTVLASGTNGYVLDATVTADSATAGTGTVSQAAGYGAEYHGNGTTSGGTLSNVFQPIAAANGPTDTDTMTLTERAWVSAIQKAASDYTDTLTVVAAGRF